MRICYGAIVVLLATLWAASPVAQEAAPATQLSNQFDANSYYAEQERAAWRNNAEKLSAIDQAHRDALTELSQENSRRLNEITQTNSAAHKALAEQDVSSAERSAESKRLQAETDKQRVELREWYAQARGDLNADHASRRAAQTASTNDLIDRIREERVATLQRLLDGPIPLSSLPAMTFPDEAEPATHAGNADATDDSSTGPGVVSSGIDVSGTVPTDSLGEEIVANENAEQFALYERLFNEEKARRDRAEEEAASRLDFIMTTQAEANTTASRRPRTAEECEIAGDADFDGAYAVECGGDDCDDSDPDRYPGNTEVGDLDDEDCNPATFGEVDRDGDGYYSAMHCNGTNCGNDCDDSRASVNPGAGEICNYVDDNCDGDVDTGVLALKYLDRDGDRHGDPTDSILVCAFTNQNPLSAAEWLSEIGNDCDDTDPGVWNDCS